MGPYLNIHPDDPSLPHSLEKARVENQRSPMGDSRLNDDIRPNPVQDFLDSYHVRRVLNDRPSHPAESVGIFFVPPDLQPSLGKGLESVLGIKRNGALFPVLYRREGFQIE